VSEVHLNSNQFAAWMAGDRPAEIAVHLDGCVVCRAEVTRFESAVSRLRSSLSAVSDAQRIPVFRPPSRAWGLRMITPALGWSVAAAVAVVLMAVPFYKAFEPSAKPHSIRQVAAADVSDAVLFEQVNAQLSRNVPGAMEPLALGSATDVDAKATTSQENE
jgi:anti-sigma factor RsiW